MQTKSIIDLIFVSIYKRMSYYQSCTVVSLTKFLAVLFYSYYLYRLYFQPSC